MEQCEVSTNMQDIENWSKRAKPPKDPYEIVFTKHLMKSIEKENGVLNWPKSCFIGVFVNAVVCPFQTEIHTRIL